jgi:multiple sugar transport system permease protein
MSQTSPKSKIMLKKISIYIPLTIVLFITLFPIIWLSLMSLKTRVDIFTLPPPLFFKITLDNYISAFIEKEYFKYLINSLIVALSTTVLAITAGSITAYAFSKFKGFLADNHLFFWILTFRMSPEVIFIIPYYLLWTILGLYDTHLSLILSHTTFTLPIVIWLMKGFFDDIPKDVEEAALLDGCSWFSVFRRISLPLATPGLMTSAILSFLFSWNEFFIAMVITRINAKTLPAAITGFITTRGILWGEMAAVGVVVMIPVLILIFLIQKYLVRGLTFGAVQ